jgi:hypothetical protein
LATPSNARPEASLADSQAPTTVNPAMPELTPPVASDFRPDASCRQHPSTDSAALRN